MARLTGFGRWALVTSLAMLSLSVLPRDWSSVNAQAPTAPHMRAREALKAGQEAYQDGNYEDADNYLRQAQAGSGDLNYAERADLDHYLKQNNAALQARRDGVAMMRRLEQAIAENRMLEAADFAKTLMLKRDFLAGADKDKCNQLLDRTWSWDGSHGSTAPSNNGSQGAEVLAHNKLKHAQGLLAQGRFDAADQLAHEVEEMNIAFGPNEMSPRKLRDEIAADRKDPHFLLKAGRTALDNHDLEQAELLAKAADGGASMLTFVAGDSPIKLQKDIEKARKKGQGSGSATEAAKDSPGMVQSVKSFFGMGKGKGKEQGAPNPPPVPAGGEGNQVGGPPMPDASTDLAIREAADAVEAYKLMLTARQALDQGQLTEAEKTAQTVKDRNPDTRNWPDQMKPDAVLAECHARQAGATPPGAPNLDVRAASKPTGDASHATGSASDDPHVLVKQSKEAFEAGHFEEAEALAIRARTADTKKTSWGLFEDTPNALLNKISKAKAKHDREESVKVLAEARKALDKGDFDAARKLVYQAQDLHHGDYVWYEMGDRPARVMADIESAEHKKGIVRPPQGSADVVHQPPTGGPGRTDNQNLLPPSHGSSGSGMALPNDGGYLANSVTAAHEASPGNGSGQPAMTGDIRQASTAPSALQMQRGLQYIAEGRMLESKGRLIEAMQRYQEAQRLLGLPEPGHEDPAGEAIIALRSTAYRDVNGTLDGIADAVKDAAREPSKYQKVESDLVRARQIAAAFQLDVAAVDQKAAWVSAVKNGSKSPVSDFIPDMTAGTPDGQDLIKKGYLCLRNGNLTEARKIARHAFEPNFGVQEYAKQLSRRIDDEELNQKRMTENRSFDAGKERYNQKDFLAARQIMDQINMRMLDPVRQASFREVMNDPQMRGVVMQAGGQSGDGGLQTLPNKVNNDQSLPSATAMQENFLRDEELKQDLKFQKLQSLSREAQSRAIEAERQGDLEGALAILKQESDELSRAELSPDKVATLRRPVEHRIQEFNTIKAQLELQKTRDEGRFITYGSKSPHELAKNLKEKQVADLMDQYAEFSQDHKYADARRVAALAVDLDPDNAQCQFALRSAELEIRIEEQKKLHDRKEDFDLKAMRSSDDLGNMPENGYMSIDKDYADRMKKRESLGGLDKGISLGTKNAIEKEIEHRLYSPVNLKFVDRPLEDVVKDIGHLQGINTFLDTTALAEMGINPKQPISFEFGQGAPLKSGLDLMLSQLKLTHMIQSDALVITTEQRAKGKLERRVFYVPDLVTPRPNTPNAPHVLGMQSNSSVQDNTPAPTINGSTVASPGQSAGAASANQNSKNGTTYSKGPPTIEGELIRLITNAVNPDSWYDRGGHGTIDYYPLGGELIVNQTPDILEQVQDLLTALRRMQDLEVSVEIRLVTVSDNFFERIGVDFSANILTNNHKYDQQLVSGVFQQPGFIGSFQPKNFISGIQQGGAFTPDLNIPIQTQSFEATPVPSFAFPGAGPIGGLDVGIAFLSDIQLYMFLEAVQYDQRAHIMQAPKIMMFNGQQATLSVTTDFFLTTGLNVQQVSGHIIATPNSSLLPNGVSITVVPIVSADRRFVRLDINQTMTNIGTINIFPITALAFNSQVQTNGGLVTVQPPLVFTNFMQQPSVETLTVNTSVNVPDGGTVVMGGFKALAEGRNEAGPPILSKIPYVDRLFRNVSYGRSSQHLVMLVTPRIIITEEEEINATGISGANFGPGGGPVVP